MSRFKAVSSQVDFPALEDEVSKFWKDNKVFEKSVEQRSPDNLYTFVDGPPFVSGLPHYGHLLTSIAKDMIPRYQTMLGKRVRRVFGWDCHGLPIEEKVSKLLAVKDNIDLEKRIGIEKYVQECRKYVQNCTDEWRWYVEKVGRWVDMDHAYYTMDLPFMESVIWGFKKIYEKGLIYKGKRVSLFSTDTSTPVSNFEVAMDPDNYRDVEDLSIFVKFEIEKSPGFLKIKEVESKPVYLVAWTTTPWTIPANFALAVHPKLKYVLVEYDSEYFIVVKSRLRYTFAKPTKEVGRGKEKEVSVLKEFEGKKLNGVIYKPVYDFFVDQKATNDFKVYLSEDVTTDEGTGVIHIAPAFGEVDFQLGQKYHLSGLSDIDNEGIMAIGPWKGVYLRDASPLIAEDLVEKGNLLRSETYCHRLPFYRGENPLIYMAQDAYFINIQAIKKRMLELNEKISWIPAHLKHGRFGQTLETSPDWCISRNRYWATIMPLWKSEYGEEIVMGSIEEMMQYTDQITKRMVEGKEKYFFGMEPMDLHRDICDKIVFTKDGKQYRRVPEVLDCWMDSGSVPFAEYHYPFENKEIYERSRPADFIIEYTPQVRAWFNVLLRVATILFDDTAFLNAVSHGTIAGTDGRKMSKSFGNYPDPKLVLEKYGADALRVYFMGSPIMKGGDMNFSEEGVAENYKFLLVFWNTYKFFTDYALLNEWNPTEVVRRDELSILDKWVLARLNQLIIDLHKAFGAYDVISVTNALKKFTLEDLSTWYIRRSRNRVDPWVDQKAREVTLSIMHEVLLTLVKLAAPLVPFITEEMYRNLTGEESVHLSDYPQADKTLIDKKLIEDMVKVRRLAELGHSQRKEAGIKLRQPLQKFTYSLSESLSKELEQILAEELNIKEIEYQKSSKDIVSGKMDIKVTPQLQEEGNTRELIRQVQQLRKEARLTLKDRINIFLPETPKRKDLLEMLLQQTNTDSISFGEKLEIKVISA
ncbi:MAG: isoleucine--tRNA ligase [bacterium]|nr:isoleucine--tRNA ligase [bacterium]